MRKKLVKVAVSLVVLVPLLLILTGLVSAFMFQGPTGQNSPVAKVEIVNPLPIPIDGTINIGNIAGVTVLTSVDSPSIMGA